MFSSNLKTLLGSYHPNVLGPDQTDYEIEECFKELSPEAQEELLKEMKILIKEEKIDSDLLSKRTGETFLKNRDAVDFFVNLHKFLSQNGPEPDIYDYIE